MSLQNNQTQERDLNKLESQRANIETSYHELHNGVKHYDYEKVQKFSERFTKEVMTYLHDVRKVKEQLNGGSPDSELFEHLQNNTQFLQDLKGYLGELKTLSKSYKKNDNFKHATELAKIMDDEDARIVELEQALHSVVGLV